MYKRQIDRAAKIDIAKCITAVDMSVTINGKKTALDDLPADTLVPRGAPVSITVKYDNVDHALENLSEGTVLHHQLPLITTHMCYLPACCYPVPLT